MTKTYRGVPYWEAEQPFTAWTGELYLAWYPQAAWHAPEGEVQP